MSDPVSNPVSDPLSIIVYSDVICPWCYVGKRRLEAALDGPDVPAARRALPGGPLSSIPTCPPRASSGTSTAPAIWRRAQRRTRPQHARDGSELGIAFAFDRMQRTPNTRLAHRAIWEAGRQGRQDALVERLF